MTTFPDLIWSHLLKKSLMENYIFCAVNYSYIVQTLLRTLFFSLEIILSLFLLLFLLSLLYTQDILIARVPQKISILVFQLRCFAFSVNKNIKNITHG